MFCRRHRRPVLTHHARGARPKRARGQAWIGPADSTQKFASQPGLLHSVAITRR
jgi:hypothetical protein